MVRAVGVWFGRKMWGGLKVDCSYKLNNVTVRSFNGIILILP